MSISDKLTSLQGTVEDIRQSIVSKDVPVATTDGFKVYPDAVRAINFQDYTDTALKPTIHGVNYYDYNGDLLYVYTPQEFLALSAHPSQPAHTGLVADGWNWSLSDAQTFIRNTCDCLNIGGLYNTSDGRTEIYLTLDRENEYYNRGVYFRAKRTSTSYSLTFDWGDGTSLVRNSGINASFTNLSNWKTYESAGSKCIKISASNVVYAIGNNSSYTGIFGYAYTQNRWVIATLDKVHLGDNTQITGSNFSRWGSFVKEVSISNEDYTNLDKGINEYAFYCNTFLTGIVLPEGITTFGNHVFSSDFSLKCICLPKTAGTTCGNYCFNSVTNIDSLIIAATCTSLGTYTFNGCRNLRRVFVNGTITSIPNYTFNACTALEEVTIPNTVATLGTSAYYECLSLKHLEFSNAITSIGQNCFNSCYSLKTIVFHSTTPPIARATPFGNCTSLEKIYVPYSADHSILNAYKTATNWSTYAAKIFELNEQGNIPT